MDIYNIQYIDSFCARARWYFDIFYVRLCCVCASVVHTKLMLTDHSIHISMIIYIIFFTLYTSIYLACPRQEPEPVVFINTIWHYCTFTRALTTPLNNTINTHTNSKSKWYTRHKTRDEEKNDTNTTYISHSLLSLVRGHVRFVEALYWIETRSP